MIGKEGHCEKWQASDPIAGDAMFRLFVSFPHVENQRPLMRKEEFSGHASYGPEMQRRLKFGFSQPGLEGKARKRPESMLPRYIRSEAMCL